MEKTRVQNGQEKNHFSRREKVLGQFMTPAKVAEFMVNFSLSALDKTADLTACDPACGDGIFLDILEKQGVHATGVDIDTTIIKGGAGHENIVQGDGLRFQHDGEFDPVIGNPPFSSKYGRVNDPDLLGMFVLGQNRASQAIEILFLEKFVRLTRPGGVVAIILPEGVFASLNLEYVRKWVLSVAGVVGIVTIPANLFAGANVSTSILFLRRKVAIGKSFLGIAESVDDLEKLEMAFSRCEPSASPLGPADHCLPWSCFTHLESDTFLPRHLRAVELTDGIPLWQLLSGTRNGATLYGTRRRFASSGIPYIGAINITESGVDLSKRCLFVEPGSPMDIARARVRAGDVLFVRVGAGCIGRAAVVPPELDGAIADDWLYILRPKEGVSPEHISEFFYTEEARRFISAFKRGTGAPTIPKSVLLKLRVPEPTDKRVVQNKGENHDCRNEAGGSSGQIFTE